MRGSKGRRSPEGGRSDRSGLKDEQGGSLPEGTACDGGCLLRDFNIWDTSLSSVTLGSRISPIINICKEARPHQVVKCLRYPFTAQSSDTRP